MKTYERVYGRSIRIGIIYCVAITGILAGSGCDDRPEAPSIVFAPYRSDYGTIREQNRSVEAEFVFRNEGTQPLRITKAEGSCKCRVQPVYVPEHPIAPSASDRIVLSIAFAAREGMQQVEVYVHSNDPKKPVVQLDIAARVEPDIVVSTNAINLGDMRIGETRGGTFQVRVPTTLYAEESQCVRIASGSASISTKWVDTRKLKTAFGDVYVLTCAVQLTAKDLTGPLDEVLQVSHAQTGAVRQVRLVGKVIGNLDVYPQKLIFGVVNPAQSVSRKVRITGDAHRSFQIVNVESNHPAFVPAVVELDAGAYEIDVTLRSDGVPTGLTEAEMTVLTNDSQQSVVRIPIVAYVAGDNSEGH